MLSIARACDSACDFHHQVTVLNPFIRMPVGGIREHCAVHRQRTTHHWWEDIETNEPTSKYQTEQLPLLRKLSYLLY